MRELQRSVPQLFRSGLGLERLARNAKAIAGQKVKKRQVHASRNLPLAIDPALIAEIDELVKATGESRSLIMRLAIRAGLPTVREKMDWLRRK